MAISAPSRTFAVSDVAPAQRPLPDGPYSQEVARFLLARNIESCSRYHGRLVSGIRSHPLIAALHGAYSLHYPLTLSPDIIWLTLTQGLAHHINANAETLRKRIVAHEGKVTLVVCRDDFVKGTPENPWAEVFAEFSQAIRKHIGESHSLIVADFSTTGSVERAASEVVLMDAMQAFFSYEVHTWCGIPSITLLGTGEDWEKVSSRVREFARFDIGWWLEPLEPILDQFVEAAKGQVDRPFWDSIYKWGGPHGSGSTHVSGWILNLFPYLDNPDTKWGIRTGVAPLGPPLIRNPWMKHPGLREGPGRGDFPCMPSVAPVRWEYYLSTLEMEFIGGLIGVT